MGRREHNPSATAARIRSRREGITKEVYSFRGVKAQGQRMPQVLSRVKKGSSYDITMKGGKRGVRMRVTKRAINPEKKRAVVCFNHETMQEVYVEARMLAGFDGIVANGYGLGVRVREESIREARLAVKEGDPRFDDETAKIVPEYDYTCAGVPIDTKPATLASKLREGGWSTLPMKAWVDQITNTRTVMRGSEEPWDGVDEIPIGCGRLRITPGRWDNAKEEEEDGDKEV